MIDWLAIAHIDLYKRLAIFKCNPLLVHSTFNNYKHSLCIFSNAVYTWGFANGKPVHRTLQLVQLQILNTYL